MMNDSEAWGISGGRAEIYADFVASSLVEEWVA
jgi:hypothetical protein